MKEREISIVDLMVDILLHWRMFIIWMVIGAVLLGAFSYARSRNAVKQQSTKTEAELESEEDLLKGELSEIELENVNYILDYEDAYVYQKAYEENRALLQMDPEHIGKSEATIAVDGGEGHKSYDIETIYEDIVVSGEMAEKVAAATGMKTSDISEMLFLAKGRSSTMLGETESIVTFRVWTIHSDETESKKMLDTVIAFLKEKKPGVENMLGEHELTVVNESFAVVTDMQIADKKLTSMTDLAAMRKTLADAREKLSETERPYYDYLISEELAEEEEGTLLPAQASSPRVSKKYVFLGAVMAVFLYAFVLLLLYIFNTKLRPEDNLQELYDIPQLGTVLGEKKRKKVLGIVDEWILSLRNRNKRQFMPEEALELAGVAVKMAAGKEELHEICLIGCGLKGQPLDACEKMKAWLEKEGIQVKILNNVLYDARMMEELEKAKGAVLIGGAGTTLYNEIVEELGLLGRQGIKVLGGILVE
ncbi:MAG: hypothetical protein HDQ96_09670 [Lachnospiraceae bacterium]|nr:hypothetical protein [Lachnospiraceae bacterium]